MVEFYHIDPDRLYENIPRWQIEILIRQLPALEADEQLQLADAAMIPHAEEKAMKRRLKQLETIARGRLGGAPRGNKVRPAIQVERMSKEQAAAWLHEHGAKVVESNGGI